jgi:hypothetical protein
MKLGRWVIMRMHPAEKELRKVQQLTPALRELVARMARAAAKDAVQDVMEAQGLAWRTVEEQEKQRLIAKYATYHDPESEETPWYAKGLTPDQAQMVTDGIDYVNKLNEDGQ